MNLGTSETKMRQIEEFELMLEDRLTVVALAGKDFDMKKFVCQSIADAYAMGLTHSLDALKQSIEEVNAASNKVLTGRDHVSTLLDA